MKFNFLTNPDPLLQEKMRFFADYFLFTNEYIGRIPELPFETCRTLTNKILFQLKNNLEKCTSYIESYFEQLNFFYAKNFAIKSDLFVHLEKQLVELKNFYNECAPDKKKYAKVNWIKSTPDFIENVKKLEIEYTQVLDRNFDSLFGFLQCSCSLKKHKEAIKYCTHNLVSELRLNGHTKESVSTYIGRILNKDSFPLPAEILMIQDNELRKAKEVEFLKSRNFKDQFYGLKNLITALEFQSGIFIYKIENCILETNVQKEFFVQIDQVTFISPHHKALFALRTSAIEYDQKRSSKIHSRFFSKQNILAYVNLNYENQNAAMRLGLKSINQELVQLESYLDTKLNLNNKDYLFVKSFDSKISGGNLSMYKKKNTPVNRGSFENAQSNPFEVLRQSKSISKEQILYNERTYIKAFTNNAISTYWLYIENLFWNSKFEKVEEQQKKFGKILLNNFKLLKEEFLRSMVELITMDIFPGDFKLSHEERKHIFNEVYVNNNFGFDISVYKEKVNSKLFNEMVNYYQSFDSNSQKEKWKKYFAALLLELYEYRNLDLHSGRVNQYSTIKLNEILPSLMNKARWSIIDASKENENLSFNDLIDLITQ